MATPVYAGTLRGEFGVSADGGATYTIPLPLPPGTAGLAPELALAYNSNSGNDVLGVGWRLQGLSAITRIGGSPARDGFRGSVTYTGTDRYSLDGARLIAVSGTYGAPGAVYHTEIESWKKVIASHGADPRRNGPDSFTVYQKDGRRCDYGTTADSRIAAGPSQPSIRVWALSRVTDRRGNYCTVTYAQDGGSFYVTAIEYTGTNAGPPQRRVEFSYEQRPDPYTHYVAGNPIAMTRRLTAIDVSVSGTRAYGYRIGYETAGVTSRSRLVSVAQVDAAGGALSPTRFGWQEGEPSLLAPRPTVTPTPAGFGGSFLPVDVDGDGQLDFINAYPVKTKLAIDVYRARDDGTGFEDRTPVPVPDLTTGGQLLPMDVNADGCTDLVYTGKNGSQLGITVFLATRDSSGRTSYQAGPVFGGVAGIPAGGIVYPADIDGNGAIDLIYARRDGATLEFTVLKSTGTAFAKASVTQTSLPRGGVCIAMDLQGDGMVDLVYAYRGDNNELQLALLHSDGNALAIKTTAALPAGLGLAPTGALMPMDINGDGLADLVHAGRASDGSLVITPLVNTGAGFLAMPSQSFPDIPFRATLLPADLTGDGVTDLLVATRANPGTNLCALLSTGSGFRKADVGQPLQGQAWSDSILPLDVSGVGKSGVVHFGQAQGKLSVASVLPAGPMPDLLTMITNGVGGTISVRYAPMTDAGVYTQSAALKAAGMFNGGSPGATFAVGGDGLAEGTPGAIAPVMKAMFPRYLVASYTRSDGRGASYAYHNAFSDALLDFAGGRGWLGFATQTSVDVDLGATTVTSYRQDFPFMGAVASSVVSRTSDNAKLVATSMQYTSSTPYAGVYQPLGTTTTNELFTAGRRDATLTTTTEYDRYGNPSFVTAAGDAPLYTRSTYSNDEQAWVIGLCTATTRAADAAATTVLSDERTDFDQATGNVTAKRAWHDQSKQWLETRFSYDGCGNVTSQADPAGATRELTYDATYHTFVTSMSEPGSSDEGGARLLSTFEYEPVFGQLVGVRDENGVARKTTLDGLGRVRERMGPMPGGQLAPLAVESLANDSTGFYRETKVRLDWEGTRWQAKREYIDGLDRVFRTTTIGADGTTPVIADKGYNSKNLVVRETSAYFDGRSADASVLTYAYDAMSRLTQTTEPSGTGTGGRRTTYEYPDSFTVVMTEAAGTSSARQTTTVHGTFNDRHLPVRITDALGAVTTTTYDPMGRTTGMTDPTGTVTTTAYDSLDNPTAVVVRNAARTIRSESTTYDLAGGLVTRTDSRGCRLEYVHDAMGRVVSVKANDGDTTTLSYDDAAVGARGRVSSVTLPDGDGYTFAYDAYGNQTKIVVRAGSVSYGFVRDFLPSNRLGRVTNPDGSTQTYGYTAGGMMESVTLASNGATLASVAYSGYNSAGKPAAVRYGNGVIESLGYNAAGQLAAQSVAGNAGAVLLDHGFRWDALNNLSAIDDRRQPSRSYGFDYDKVGRLTAANGPYATPQRFRYDPAGNLVEKAGDAMHYESGLLLSGAGVTLGYDAAGNTTSIQSSNGTSAMAYDAAGRLIQAGPCTFTYDYTGRRLSKHVEGGATTYYITPDYEVTIENGVGEQRSVNLRGAFGLAATVSVGGGSVCYFHRSQVNSTALVTDGAGQQLASIEYLPFGETSAFTGSDVFRYKFAGRELDAETGLYHFGERYYAPSLGRFMSADTELGATFGRSDALNPYAYVLNSPVTFMDPTGHSIFESVGVFFAKSESTLAQVVAGAAQAFTSAANATANYMQESGKKWVPGVVSGLLIVAGIAVLATTPIGGPASAMLGGMLLGAGISGAVYAATNRGDDFSWRHWGVQVGIGAAVGLAGGAIGAGAGAMAEGLMLSGKTAFAIGGTGRIALLAVAGAVDGAGGNALSTYLTNLDYGRPPETGVGWAALVGGVTGGIGGAASGKFAGRYGRPVNPDEIAKHNLGRFTPEVVGRMRVLDASLTAKALIKASAIVTKGGGKALMTYGPHPGW